MVTRLEKEKSEVLRREETKFEAKVSSLKAINDKISKKLVTLDETQEDCHALQKSYGEAVQIIEEQKRELTTMVHECEEYRQRNGSLEEELKDLQGML